MNECSNEKLSDIFNQLINPFKRTATFKHGNICISKIDKEENVIMEFLIESEEIRFIIRKIDKAPYGITFSYKDNQSYYEKWTTAFLNSSFSNDEYLKLQEVFFKNFDSFIQNIKNIKNNLEITVNNSHLDNEFQVRREFKPYFINHVERNDFNKCYCVSCGKKFKSNHPIFDSLNFKYIKYDDNPFLESPKKEWYPYAVCKTCHLEEEIVNLRYMLKETQSVVSLQRDIINKILTEELSNGTNIQINEIIKTIVCEDQKAIDSDKKLIKK